MSKSIHDQIAENLAEKFGTEFKQQKGIDIVTPARAVEVETKPEGLDQGIKQVAHVDKARYLAVTDRLVDKAIEKTEGMGIGVMNEHGRIVKKAR